MTLITYIALLGVLFALGLGVLTLIGAKGYSFDLRRRPRRRHGKRLGGRRSDDLARAQ